MLSEKPALSSIQPLSSLKNLNIGSTLLTNLPNLRLSNLHRRSTIKPSIMPPHTSTHILEEYPHIIIKMRSKIYKTDLRQIIYGILNSTFTLSSQKCQITIS